jgi:hypothetical protein
LKKEAKTFEIQVARCRNTHTKIAKVFWFFFSKKNFFLMLAIHPRPRQTPAQ